MPSINGDSAENTSKAVIDGASGTDSVGTHSDLSGNTLSPRPKINYVRVMDLQLPEHLAHKKKAFEGVKLACTMADTKLHHIQFQKLDFEEKNEYDTFYKADVAVIDMSIQLQQSSLLYHLGLRKNFGMKVNILLLNDVDSEATIRLRLSCGNYTLSSYKILDCGSCMSMQTSTKDCPEDLIHLSQRLKKLLDDVRIQSEAHMKETFLADLRKTREALTGEELEVVLKNLRKKWDDLNVTSEEVVLNVLISFRDVQDDDAIIQLVDDLCLVATKTSISTPVIRFLYAFALSWRQKKGTVIEL
ncbi:hypothetical protein QAD02_002113 [Eretmocerus hayati]|uniref:Uncharacterized protein n=1 Tax=Eretmocerus hayati TaxID=131215 RepID=A0ACC2NHY4_9HYME|nr:hypothetical protein QAD02_002113 [Eretmocerus hayati]